MLGSGAMSSMQKTSKNVKNFCLEKYGGAVSTMQNTSKNVQSFCSEKYEVAKTFYEKHPKMIIMLLALIIVLLVIIVLCACLIPGKFSRDYYCKISSDHTMCKYQKVSSACSKVIKVGLSKEEKQKLVDAHNELRNKVALGEQDSGRDGPQPSASNMQKMIWDDELAEIAQRWAEQCLGGHDKNRESRRFAVGQNYGGGAHCIYRDKFFDLSHVAYGWYNEVNQFEHKYIQPFHLEKKYGHYSQYVWAESYLIGCGYIKHESGLINWHLICNYGPAGNVVGGTMYKVGKPASDCKTGTSQDATYTGLCS